MSQVMVRMFGLEVLHYTATRNGVNRWRARREQGFTRLARAFSTR
jgi:hypothetical protein